MRDVLLIEDYLPQSQLVVPEHHVERAKFPAIDAHVHLGQRGDRWAVEDVEALIERMDRCNVKDSLWHRRAAHAGVVPRLLPLSGDWGRVFRLLTGRDTIAG